MSCFKKCCKTEEDNKMQANFSRRNEMLTNPENIDNTSYLNALEDLYSSLQEVMKGLENIGDKKPAKNTAEMKKFFTDIAQEHDQQKKDIESMRQGINNLNEQARKDNTIKGVVQGLKDIDQEDTLGTIVNTVTSNLEKALVQLQTSKKAENQLSANLNDAKNMIEKLNTDIQADDKKIGVLTQGNIVDYPAPDKNNISKPEGYSLFKDIFGKQQKVYFLSRDGKKLMQGDELNDYDKNKFNNAKFYHLKDNQYNKIQNLKELKSLDAENIILAFQKNS